MDWIGSENTWKGGSPGSIAYAAYGLMHSYSMSGCEEALMYSAYLRDFDVNFFIWIWPLLSADEWRGKQLRLKSLIISRPNIVRSDTDPMRCRSFLDIEKFSATSISFKCIQILVIWNALFDFDNFYCSCAERQLPSWLQSYNASDSSTPISCGSRMFGPFTSHLQPFWACTEMALFLRAVQNLLSPSFCDIDFLKIYWNFGSLTTF